jgi:protein transport protein SEC61 subunit gamma-like protein
MGLKEFFKRCGIVLKISRKPKMEEVKQVSKVSALGLLIIGLIGFIITIIFTLIL